MTADLDYNAHTNFERIEHASPGELKEGVLFQKRSVYEKPGWVSTGSTAVALCAQTN